MTTTVQFITILLVLGFDLKKDTDPLTGTRWVLVQYYDFENERPVMVPESDYLYDCKFKYVIEFGSRGRFTTTVNDKWNYIGRYKRVGKNVIEIYSKITEKVYDTEECCHISTTSRIDVAGIFWERKEYEIKDDTLILKYTLKDPETAHFKRFAK